MDGVFGREGREDEELGSAWDCGHCYLFMTFREEERNVL